MKVSRLAPSSSYQPTPLRGAAQPLDRAQMIDYLVAIAGWFEFLGHMQRHWRGLTGVLMTGALAVVCFVAIANPFNWILAVTTGLAGACLSYMWDARSRRRGRAPPAGGW